MSVVLKTMGLMTRIGREKAPSLEPLVPNAETVAAMQEARNGKLARFKTVDAFMADLNAGD